MINPINNNMSGVENLGMLMNSFEMKKIRKMDIE